jgi:hypothetical protein
MDDGGVVHGLGEDAGREQRDGVVRIEQAHRHPGRQIGVERAHRQRRRLRREQTCARQQIAGPSRRDEEGQDHEGDEQQADPQRPIAGRRGVGDKGERREVVRDGKRQKRLPRRHDRSRDEARQGQDSDGAATTHGGRRDQRHGGAGGKLQRDRARRRQRSGLAAEARRRRDRHAGGDAEDERLRQQAGERAVDKAQFGADMRQAEHGDRQRIDRERRGGDGEETRGDEGHSRPARGGGRQEATRGRGGGGRIAHRAASPPGHAACAASAAAA